MSCERKLIRNTIFPYLNFKSSHVHTRGHIETVSVDGLSLAAVRLRSPYAYVIIADDILARRCM